MSSGHSNAPKHQHQLPEVTLVTMGWCIVYDADGQEICRAPTRIHHYASGGVARRYELEKPLAVPAGGRFSFCAQE